MAGLHSEQIAAEKSEQVGRQDVSQIVLKVIENMPMERRLYPDLYAHEVTRALIAAGFIMSQADTDGAYL
jgi:hypothetical protein